MSRKRHYVDAALLRQSLAMELEPLNLKQRICSEVTFTAMRAADYGNVFNHEQLVPFSIAARRASDMRSLFPAIVTNHFCCDPHLAD